MFNKKIAVIAPGITSKPYWWEAVPRPVLPDIEMPKRSDVVIVGSGYTGLSAALTLAKAGRSVLILEAEDVGFGASTRTGGLMGDLMKPGFLNMCKRYGESRAAALWREGRASFQFTLNLIESERITCELQKVGRFTGAWRPGHYEDLARELEALGKIIDIDAAMIPKAEQHRQIGSDLYHGGRLIRSHAAVHSALFHQGLLERATALGVLIKARTPAFGIVRNKNDFKIKTPNGEVTAGTVLIATNGYTGRATSKLKRFVVPINSHMIATEPLAPDLMDRLTPARRIFSDTKKVAHYFRSSPDGTRILFGGRAGEPETHLKDSTEVLYRAMIRVFPDLEGVTITHNWCGAVAYSFTSAPQIGVQDGLYYAMCYSGLGVAMAPYLGHKVALKIVGDKQGATPFDDMRSPVPFYHPFKSWGVAVAIRAYHLADRWGLLSAMPG